ncbi:hypothetical protein IAU60_004386 [Kwoniella sp. DSM 27419]
MRIAKRPDGTRTFVCQSCATLASGQSEGTYTDYGQVWLPYDSEPEGGSQAASPTYTAPGALRTEATASHQGEYGMGIQASQSEPANMPKGKGRMEALHPMERGLGYNYLPKDSESDLADTYQQDGHQSSVSQGSQAAWQPSEQQISAFAPPQPGARLIGEDGPPSGQDTPPEVQVARNCPMPGNQVSEQWTTLLGPTGQPTLRRLWKEGDKH